MANAALPRALISLPRVFEFGRLEHAGLAVGALIVGIAAFCAIFGPALVTHDAFAPDLMARLVPPAFMEEGIPEHLLGTDQIGRDYLARLVYGARISLSIRLS